MAQDIVLFVSSYTDYWVKGSQGQVTCNLISVVFRLIPPSNRIPSASYFLIVILAIMLILFIVLAGCARHYARTAKVPLVLSAVLSFFYQVLAESLCPLSAFYTANTLSDLIWNQDAINFADGCTMVIFAALCICTTSWIMMDLTSLSLVFRPISLMSVTPSPRNRFFLCSLGISIIGGFGCSAPRGVQVFCVFALLVLYTIVASLIFYQGGFVDGYVNLGVWAAGSSSAIICLIHGTFLLLQRPGELLLLFIHLSLAILCLLFGRQLFLWLRQRTLRFLDEIKEEPALFRLIKSPSTALRYGIVGFSWVHEVCLDWSFFKQSVERWPRDVILWYVFAKFTATYPEEQQTLQWIFHTVTSHRLKGKTAALDHAPVRDDANERAHGQAASAVQADSADEAPASPRLGHCHPGQHHGAGICCPASDPLGRAERR
jgi:hypothetical protein